MSPLFAIAAGMESQGARLRECVAPIAAGHCRERASLMALAAGVRAHDAGLLRPENPNPALWTFSPLFTRLGQRLE